MINREIELLNYQRNLEAEMRKLQEENRSLRTLISLLNSMEARDQAQKMAQEIFTRGVSDDLLSRAQHLVASQVWEPLLLLKTQAKAPQRPGRAGENPQWSTP
jgi:predicted Holliday junction resolvase-like endonuclease